MNETDVLEQLDRLNIGEVYWAPVARQLDSALSEDAGHRARAPAFVIAKDVWKPLGARGVTSLIEMAGVPDTEDNVISHGTVVVDKITTPSQPAGTRIGVFRTDNPLTLQSLERGLSFEKLLSYALYLEVSETPEDLWTKYQTAVNERYTPEAAGMATTCARIVSETMRLRPIRFQYPYLSPRPANGAQRTTVIADIVCATRKERPARLALIEVKTTVSHQYPTHRHLAQATIQAHVLQKRLGLGYLPETYVLMADFSNTRVCIIRLNVAAYAAYAARMWPVLRVTLDLTSAGDLTPPPQAVPAPVANGPSETQGAPSTPASVANGPSETQGVYSTLGKVLSTLKNGQYLGSLRNIYTGRFLNTPTSLLAAEDRTQKLLSLYKGNAVLFNQSNSVIEKQVKNAGVTVAAWHRLVAEVTIAHTKNDISKVIVLTSPGTPTL